MSESMCSLLRPQEQAIACLRDVYRVAYFLLGSQLQAEELVEAAYAEVWRRHSRVERVVHWRVDLLQSLLDLAGTRQFSGIERRPEEVPAFWGALSKLDFSARVMVLLEALDLPVKQIAGIVKAPETSTAHRLEAARATFFHWCRDE